MGKLVGLQLLSAVVISLVLNAPVLLVTGGTGRVVVLVALGVLLVLVAVAALGHRSGPTTETQVAEGVGVPVSDRPDVQRWLRRRQRLARLQGPALLVGLVGGSVAGAALGSWWWEAVGGAVGYGVVCCMVLLLLSPRRLLSGPRRPPPRGARGPR